MGTSDPDCYGCIDVTRLPIQWIEVPSALIIFVCLVTITLAVVRRVRLRRGPARRPIEIAEYSPPEGMNVMVAAHLVNRSRTAVPAQLLQLAVDKQLRVLEAETAGRRVYAVELIRFEGSDEIGEKLLSAIFSNQPIPGTVRELRADDGALANAIAAVSAHAFGESRKNGWRDPASLTQWGNVATTLFTALFLLTVGVLSWATTVSSPWLLLAAVSTVLAIAVAFATLSFAGPLTAAGGEARDQILGIRTYLRLAEDDRLRILQSASAAERGDGPGSAKVIRIYERLLPYAVVLGVDRSWIAELIGNATELDRPPEWVANPNLLSFLNVIGRWKIALKSARLERAESRRQPPLA